MDKNKYILSIRESSPNAKYCKKCQVTHENRIKFTITQTGIYQSSFSDNKKCKTGKDPFIRLSRDLRCLLFGEGKQDLGQYRIITKSKISETAQLQINALQRYMR